MRGRCPNTAEGTRNRRKGDLLVKKVLIPIDGTMSENTLYFFFWKFVSYLILSMSIKRFETGQSKNRKKTSGSQFVYFDVEYRYIDCIPVFGVYIDRTFSDLGYMDGEIHWR